MSTFETFVPAGWVRFELEEPGPLEERLDALVRLAAPVDQPTVRRSVEEVLKPSVAALREAGTVAMLTPAVVLPVPLAAPMITFTPWAVPDDTDPVELLAATTSQIAGATLVDVPGLVSVRFVETGERGEPQAAPSVVGSAARAMATTSFEVRERITSILGAPELDTPWMSIATNVGHDGSDHGQQLAQRQVGLYDAIVQTFRWVS